MSEVRSERRWRMIHCDPQLILMLLNWCRNPMKIVGLPKLSSQIPADCEVVSINSCWDRRSIDMIISHPSFDDVADDTRIPDFETDWSVREQLFNVEDGVVILNGTEKPNG